MPKRIGGAITFKADGESYLAKGNFTYNLGKPKREGQIGSDLQNHGYKEIGQIPFIEGEITDTEDVDTEYLLGITKATVTLELANGKVIMLKDAYYAHEGTGESEDGKLPVRFEGKKGSVVR